MARAPDAENYFGTDQIGRDNLSRIIYGARASLIVAISAVLLGTTTGRCGARQWLYRWQI
jgi:peptide/nickel transport system permease protein